MKNGHLLILVILLLSIPAFSQEYLPLVRSDAEWSIHHTLDYFNTPNTVRTEHYRIGKDTLIEGLIWQQLYYCTDPEFSWDSPNLFYGGVIREADRKVFYEGPLFSSSNDPMFDFNVTVGDTIWRGTDDVTIPHSLYVHKLDTLILSDGIARKQIHLNYYDHYNDFISEDISIWVEGIGNLRRGLIERRFQWDRNKRSGDELMCYKVSDSLLYDSPKYPSCYVQNVVGIDTTIEYLPLLTPDKEWSILHRQRFLVDPDENSYKTNKYTEHYRLGSDTLVDGQLWKNVYYSRDTFFSWNDPDLQWAGIMREVDKRVYYRGDLADYPNDIAYDFNLILGDTLWHGLDHREERISLVVTGIDTAYLNDQVPRKRWHLRFYFHEDDGIWDIDNMVWIAGLGEITNGLLPRINGWRQVERAEDRLQCFREDQQLVYLYRNDLNCFTEEILVGDQEPSIPDLKVYPNPSEDYYQLSTNHQLQIDRIVVFDQLGRSVFQVKQQQLIGDIRIDATEWSSGVYFLVITSGKQTKVMKLMKSGH